MTKSQIQEKKPPKSRLKEKGQLSIFLGVSLTIVITLLAFIINVGLFVKAKINLQNAVDAAAWSGAAVQARQLTNIGYLNWEIRNVYKEWMFKYYVLGQLGIRRTDPDYITTQNMSYRLRVFDGSLTGVRADPYNLPTICIHYGSPNNVCDIYNVPGLPRFPSHNIPGISQRLETFVSEIRDEKSRACVHRSVVNQTTAILWTYGTGDTDVFQGIPLVLSHREGAWPQALELAFRMRNLEAMVNRPPADQPICHPSNSQRAGPCTPVTDEAFQSEIHPIHERPTKAFWSAYRNLSGGAIKDTTATGGEELDEFIASFRLTEIAPQPVEVDPSSLSGLLIPNVDFAGGPALTKHYLDLLINPINYAIVYTSYIPTTDASGQTVSGQSEEGACAGSKTALPVPAYITGFTKNNNLMTYYSVRGDANFSGLFYPFRSSIDGIQLSAYAAAKPFGGRIGPRYFGYPEAVEGGPINMITPRQPMSSGGSRSGPYISGIDTASFGNDFKPGDLLPFSQDFWLTSATGGGANAAIGGSPATVNSEPKFGIPNMIYDYERDRFNDLHQAATAQTEPLFTLTPHIGSEGALPNNPSEDVGLYNSKQFLHLRENLDIDIPDDGTVDVNALDMAVDRSRRPTYYEALNYLIPTPDAGNIDTPPIVQFEDDGSYRLYAPLLDDGGQLLYQDGTDLVNRSYELILNSEKAIDLYIDSLEEAARAVREIGQGLDTVDDEAYHAAYNSIYPLDDPNAIETSGSDCDSMAEMFHFFFLAQTQNSGCNGNYMPLQELLTNYFSDLANNPARRTFYYPTYVLKQGTNLAALHSAYMPGPLTGAAEDGLAQLPITNSTAPRLSRRNFYSTKLIPADNLTQGSERNYGNLQLHFEESNTGSLELGAEFMPGVSNFVNHLTLGDLVEFTEAGRLDF